MRKSVIGGLAAAIALLPVQSFAADTFAPSEEEIASAIDIAFGATITSRYVSRGVDFSDGPALQGYIEASYDLVYAGIWASTVDGPNVDPADDVEFNLYVGLRPTFGDLTLDFGYVHYLYDDTGSCCGELYAKASYDFTEAFSAGAEIYQDLRFDTTYGALTAAFVLPYDFTVSGAVGTWFDGDHDWNVGLSYTFADTLTLDGRYHDSNHSPARFVVSLSVDTSWSALRSGRDPSTPGLR